MTVRNLTLSHMSLSLPPNPGSVYDATFQGLQYDHTPHETQEQIIAESPSIDRYDELLGFQPFTQTCNLLDYHLRRTSVSLGARLHGMFFMADPPSTLGLFPQMTPPELTCYRRNLFHVTGSITLPKYLRYVLTDPGERIPIMAQELSISATETVEGHPVKLISVPWKTPIGQTPTPPEDKTEKEPTSIPLDVMATQNMETEYATFPFAWKRLQFRIATANNGRRKELQQHFVLRLKLIVTLLNSTKVCIAEAQSSPIVVRGRSPRNFQQRKDQAVGDRSAAAVRSKSTASVAGRTESAPPQSPLKRKYSPEDTTSSAYNFSPNSNDPHAMSAYISPWNTKFANGEGSNSAPVHPTPPFRTPTVHSSQSVSSASPPLKQEVLSPQFQENERPLPQPRPGKAQRRSKGSSSRPGPPSRPPSLPPSLPSVVVKTPLSELQAQKSRSLDEGIASAEMLYDYFPVMNVDAWTTATSTQAHAFSHSGAVYAPHVPLLGPQVTMAGSAGAGLSHHAVMK